MQEEMGGSMQGSPTGLETWVSSNIAAGTEEKGVAGCEEYIWGGKFLPLHNPVAMLSPYKSSEPAA